MRENPLRRLWADTHLKHHSYAQANTVDLIKRLLYRAAVAQAPHEHHLLRWRWHLPIWTNADRRRFDETMAKAYAAKIRVNPLLIQLRPY